MADKKNEATATVGGTFNEREMTLMANAMLCLKSGLPEVDYEKLAARLGMTNKGSAGNAWNALKKKLLEAAGGETGAGAPATPKKAAGRPKKTPSKIEKEDDDGDAGDEAPAPKTTSGKKKRAAAAKELDGQSPNKKGKKVKEEQRDDSGAEGVTPSANGISEEEEEFLI